MRIAVTYDRGRIFDNFGHTPQFKFYNTDRGKTYREQVIDAPSKKGHAVRIDLLKKLSTDILICDRIGDKAQKELKAAGITIYPSITGNADQAAIAFLLGTLPENDINAGDK